MTASPTEPRSPDAVHGFTLVELSLVLLIISLLSSGLIIGLAAQRSITEQQTAQHQLDEIRETLIGFALANGRLPCPARPQLASTDALAGKEDCSLQHGVMPWLTLALPESDPWGNRFTYYASERFSAQLEVGASASFTLDTLGNAKLFDSSGKTLATDLPAIVVCHGRNASGAFMSSGQQVSGATGEESENADADLSFISHTPTPSFDDHVTWIIPSLLKARMVSAGKLP